MTDQNTDADAADNAGGTDTTDAAGRTFTQAELDRIVADRVGRERQKYADYGELKKRAAAAMTEQERAVAEAEQRGRTMALSEAGTRLARAEIRAAAAGRVEKDALDGFLEYADLKKFITADGEPDGKAIEAAVAKIAGPARQTDFEGGARSTSTKAIDMNALIRQRAGLG
jgi:hypothetical protein